MTPEGISVTGLKKWLRKEIDDSFAEPRPDIPAEEVFDRLHKVHSDQLKAAGTKTKGKLLPPHKN